MSLTTILIILMVVFLFGGFTNWGYTAVPGSPVPYYARPGVNWGAVIVVLILLVIFHII